MGKPVTAADYSSINDFLARYFRFVDQNKADEWMSLWTEDGALDMAGVEPFQGARLRAIPQISFDNSGGKICHMFSNLSCDYGEDQNNVVAEFYELVTSWQSGGDFKMLGLCKAFLVRNNEGWKMRRNEVVSVK